MPTRRRSPTAEADAEGNFVAIFEVEPSAVPRALTLGATTPGGAPATSDEVVMLLPSADRPPRTARPRRGGAEAGGRRRRGGATGAGARRCGWRSAAADPGAGRGGGDGDPAGGRGRGAPSVGAGAPDGDVSLASISYAEAGDVTLAGRRHRRARWCAPTSTTASPRRRRLAPTAAGAWSSATSRPGLYRLRIDELAADGRVASRVETPFQRDYPRAPLPRPGRPAVTRARCRSPCSRATTSGLWRGSTMVRACSIPRSSPPTAT